MSNVQCQVDQFMTWLLNLCRWEVIMCVRVYCECSAGAVWRSGVCMCIYFCYWVKRYLYCLKVHVCMCECGMKMNLFVIYIYMCACVCVRESVCVYECVCGTRIRRAPMSWLRTRSAYRIIVDHSGKEYFHHIQCNTAHHNAQRVWSHVQVKCVYVNSYYNSKC